MMTLACSADTPQAVDAVFQHADIGSLSFPGNDFHLSSVSILYNQKRVFLHIRRTGRQSQPSTLTCKHVGRSSRVWGRGRLLTSSTLYAIAVGSCHGIEPWLPPLCRKGDGGVAHFRCYQMLPSFSIDWILVARIYII